jgi:hypothetical protein
MTRTINIDLDSASAAGDLAQTLQAFGLDARIRASENLEVQVRRGWREDTEELLFRVLSSVRQWLVRTRRRSAIVRVGDRRYRVSTSAPAEAAH